MSPGQKQHGGRVALNNRRAGEFLSGCERREVEDRKLRLDTLDRARRVAKAAAGMPPATASGGCIGGSRPITASRALTSTTSSSAARR